MRRGGALRVLPLPAAQTQRGQHPSRWKRPRCGWIKMNTDAAKGAYRLAGLGMVSRDSNGDIMAAATRYPVVVLSPVIAEALDLQWSMELATQLGFRSVQFGTDNLELYHAWRKRNGVSYLFSIISDCYAFIPFFDHVELSFVRRNGNSAVTYMAKNASSFPEHVWVEEGPSGLSPFLDSDVLTSMPH
ncbi:uncharacterized protein LOC130713165 [Lotus japonicus]|uniref:uncharacterized protein LOC130713165 n=1 Tax=Lotus japonicus TaxID=34305 RepID=UPI00258F897A|nr:uncharacterized protein LOC130713165 [Lotus japonicus]